MKVRVGSLLSCALGISCLLASRPADAAEIDWKGYTWSVTNGGMAGVAAGSTANVSVDSNGYLHLQIRKNGDSWTAAELFTTTRLGFGTYQWQIDGPIDTLDKNVVLGLFPYGPAAGIGDDGTNEIDIEYARWGQANGPNGDWTNYPASGTTVGEHSYTFSLSGGTLSTSRFIWTSSSIEDFLLAGLEPPSSTKSLLETWKYSPSNPKTNIPQQALPLGMNLWCYAIPSDGKNVEIIVRDFQFIPEGTSNGGAGGGSGSNGGGAGGNFGSNGGAGAGGSSATGGNGGSPATAGASAIGGTTGIGGASAASGAPASGGSANNPSGGKPNSVGGASASGGETQSPPAAGHGGADNSGESSGCSCTVAQRTRGTVWPWLLALLVLPAARARRTLRHRTQWLGRGVSRCLKSSQRGRVFTDD